MDSSSTCNQGHPCTPSVRPSVRVLLLPPKSWVNRRAPLHMAEHNPLFVAVYSSHAPAGVILYHRTLGYLPHVSEAGAGLEGLRALAKVTQPCGRHSRDQLVCFLFVSFLPFGLLFLLICLPFPPFLLPPSFSSFLFSFLRFLNIYSLCMSHCVSVCESRTTSRTTSVLSSHRVGLRHQTQIMRLGNKYLYLLSHWPGLLWFFYNRVSVSIPGTHPSCINLPSAGVTGLCHHLWLPEASSCGYQSRGWVCTEMSESFWS